MITRQQPLVHLISAFATQARQLLGMQAVAEKSSARGDVHQVESIENDHGRLETRRVVVSAELDLRESPGLGPVLDSGLQRLGVVLEVVGQETGDEVIAVVVAGLAAQRQRVAGTLAGGFE